jgi:DNA-binding beta-propeller fold protein YncE
MFHEQTPNLYKLDRMKIRICSEYIARLLLAALCALISQRVSGADAISWPGAKPDGSMLLPNQWSLRPVGAQVELGDFPVNIAVHPRKSVAAVLHCGYSEHEVVLVDFRTQKVLGRVELPEAFYGLAFNRDGTLLYCSGSSGEEVFSFRYRDAKLSEKKAIKLRDVGQHGGPSGLAVDRSGRRLYVANLWNNRISRVDLKENSVQEIALASDRSSAAPEIDPDDDDIDVAAATKRARAVQLASRTNSAVLYTCLLNEKRGELYASIWGGASVAVIDLKSQTVKTRWPVGKHPCEMALREDGKHLFVANANDNTVSVIETATGRTVETLWATMFPDSPRGATPNSVALSPDGGRLFVANANINALAVFDVSVPGKSRSLGFIPTGWYPTSVRVTPDGKHLLIANGKGNTAMANPRGPQPVANRSLEQYIARLLKGTLSIVDLPDAANFERQMAEWTATVLKCTPLRPDASVTMARPEGNPIPGRVSESSPIKYCIYIIKENRTYDQVFGDMPEGNGDSNLCLFPERVTPNHHKLARDFVLLDNFYVESEVSADGHEWSMAAYATDFVEKTWPLNYGHKRSGFAYPAEGVFPIASPASGYIWDRAKEAGVSYRSYGEFVQNGKTLEAPATTRVRTLEGHFDERYPSFDLTYPDVKRADRFVSELKRFEAQGDMPRLQIVRLPNDHTYGAVKGKLTPTALVADNDLALGKLVEAVTQSKFWQSTAIFVVEDDAQNGPDHVDAHRTVALAISPFTRGRGCDSTLYSTSSMLRTMELILGLRPMTQFDAAAVPMYNSFRAQPDLAAYTAVPANVDMRETNPVAAWGSELKFNFAKEDAADDLLLNEVVWRSVRGAHSPMPAPVRAGFVMANRKDNDD